LVLLLGVVVVLAGCGGHDSSNAAKPAAKKCPPNAKADRARARLERDIASLRTAAAHPGHDTFKGDAAVNHATDRFLLDVGTAPVDLLVKNRLIDHAAAAVSPACSQCFQALEAARPIPSIAHSHTSVCVGKRD
jgi:hypothetical protein